MDSLIFSSPVIQQCNVNNVNSYFHFFFPVCVLAKSKGSVAELKLSDTKLRQGQDLIITCEIKDKERFDIARVYRTVTGIQGGPEEFEIASNDNIGRNLKDNGRYELLEFKPGSKLTVVKVKIKSKSYFTNSVIRENTPSMLSDEANLYIEGYRRKTWSHVQKCINNIRYCTLTVWCCYIGQRS